MIGARIPRFLFLLFCGLAVSVAAFAAQPVITGVSIPNVSMKINDVVTATISVESDSATTFTLVSGDIGGYTLESLSKSNSTTYTATFTINVRFPVVLPQGFRILPLLDRTGLR